jgi:hypothetical protein
MAAMTDDPTTWFVEPFFHTLLTDQPEPAQARRQVEAATAALLAQVDDLAIDAATRTHVVLAAHAVAAYRWYLERGTEADARAAVQRAVIGPFSGWMADSVREALDAAADPYATMAETSRHQISAFYGAGFAFETVRDDDRGYLARAHRCAYHDVNVRAGHPELTAIWCEWDLAWLSAVDPSRHGFEASRPVTIGYGCDHCDFALDRR